MKTLYLIRHAKSDWSQLNQSDFDRTINERGRLSIQKVGTYLKDKKVLPDRILSSPAERAKITISNIATIIGYGGEILYYPEIYDTHMDGYEGALSCILEQEDTIEALFLVGHNYAITQLAEYLVGRELGNMPTCSVIQLVFHTQTWEQLSYGSGEVMDFIKPKEL